MLFKILQGDKSRISLDITPFHEGWCYVTTDGGFYVDMNTGTPEAPIYDRVEVTSKSAYQIAVQQGFEGDEDAWLASLKGEPGASGVYVGSGEPPANCNVHIDPDGDIDNPIELQIEAHNTSEEAHENLRSEIDALRALLDSISRTSTITTENRYAFSCTADNITYTEADHSDKIVYGGSFMTSLTPEQLADRTYYGYSFGTVGNSGYMTLATDKSVYTQGDSKMIVNFSWNINNNSGGTRPAINGALIGLYSEAALANEADTAYFDAYKYFGRILDNAFVGTTNSSGVYEETMNEYDREGVLRDITYPALQLTSWGQSSTTAVTNNVYAGAVALDISSLPAGQYKLMFVNYVCPDWPVKNIIEGMPYQILAELPVTIRSLEE